MIVAIDPGLKGAFCLMSQSGVIERLDPMPLEAGKQSSVTVARLFREYQAELDFEIPRVVIEELYTPPSDAFPQAGLDAYRALFERSGQYLTAVDGGYATQDHIEALKAAYRASTPYADAKMRVDGRKGLLSYAKGAGFLHMPALWGWPITEVKPSIWLRQMREGIDRSLAKKDQSVKVAQSLWPTLFERSNGPNFCAGERAKGWHDGKVEAALLAEWYRRRLAKESRTPAAG